MFDTKNLCNYDYIIDDFVYDCRKLAASVSVMIYFKLRDWLVCHAAHLLTLPMFIPQVRALMALFLYMHLNRMAAIPVFDYLAIPLLLSSKLNFNRRFIFLSHDAGIQ